MTVKPLTREEREQIKARKWPHAQLTACTVCELRRALATIDALEADMRWLASNFGIVMNRLKPPTYVSGPIPLEGWRSHVAPWVEPA